MEALLLVARLALAAVFTIAGFAKLRNLRVWRESLDDFGVPDAVSAPAVLVLPVAELACAVALLHDRSAAFAAFAAMALLVVFITGITANLVRGRAPNCHCFGQLNSSPVSWRTLLRNLVLLGLSGVVAWRVDQIPSAWPDVAPGSFEAAMPFAIGVLAVVLGLTLWFVFQMLQQNGRLLLRLEALERKLNIDPSDQPVYGLPVGYPSPTFELKTLAGGVVTLQTIADARKPILLVFTEPGCGTCEALQPELAAWQREHIERLTIVAVSRGEVELNRAKSAAHGLRNVLLQAGHDVAGSYLVKATPSAVLVVDGKIASPISAGSDAIRALVARATLPPPVRKGDAVPSVKLLDLTGKAVDLATVRGRRTLLLFWSPSCGFCQKMLPNVKTWTRAEGAPELVVISSGSIKANLEQGLTAKVLLDPHFGSGQMFGAKGTPSAVVLDEEGRVASEVGVGAPAVFALAEAEVPAIWS